MAGHDQFDYASLTDVGIRRSHNQDNHAILLAANEEEWKRHGHVFVVADGMGAHAVGELASEISVSIIPHTYQKHADEGTVRCIKKAFFEANNSIYTRGQQNREFKGMGTTTSALFLRPEGAWVGHVGDSRVYRIREGVVDQLSFDHSLVWELAKRQKVSPEGIHGIPTNVIVRSMGPEPRVQVDVEGPHPLKEGDLFLMCSDGLSGPLNDQEMGAVVSALPPVEACRFLVDLTNLRGGPDNITVVIVKVGKVPDAPPAGTTPATQRPWHRRIPWPQIVLVLGIGLAGYAIAARASHQQAMLIFILAALVIVAGLAGLIYQFVTDPGEDEEERPEKRKLRIHRSTPFKIEKPLIDKVAKAIPALQQTARDRQWDVDWETVDRHHAKAEASMNKNDLLDAFREYCRALLPLTAALNRHRHKEEIFQPVWDKKSKSAPREGAEGE